MRLYRKQRPWRFFTPLFVISLVAVLVIGMCLAAEHMPPVVLGWMLALFYGGGCCYLLIRFIIRRAMGSRNGATDSTFVLGRRRPPSDPGLPPGRLTNRKRRGPPRKREPEI
jgi:hypothetical protein